MQPQPENVTATGKGTSCLHEGVFPRRCVLFFNQYFFNFKDVHGMIVFIRIPFFIQCSVNKALGAVFLCVQFAPDDYRICFCKVWGLVIVCYRQTTFFDFIFLSS